MLALFNDYKNEADKLTKEYEARYGSLTVNSNSIGNSTFNWVMSWPWEESKYCLVIIRDYNILWILRKKI